MKHFAFVLACGLFLSLVSCTGGGDSSPSGVVKAYMEAMKAGDEAGSLKYVQAKDREFFQKMGEMRKSSKPVAPPKDSAYKIGKETITGDTAVVTVTGTYAGKEQKPQDYKLIKEDGAWKIAFLTDDMRKKVEGAGGPAAAEASKAMMEKMQKQMQEQAQKTLSEEKLKQLQEQAQKALEDAKKQLEEGTEEEK